MEDKTSVRSHTSHTRSPISPIFIGYFVMISTICGEYLDRKSRYQYDDRSTESGGRLSVSWFGQMADRVIICQCL